MSKNGVNRFGSWMPRNKVFHFRVVQIAQISVIDLSVIFHIIVFSLITRYVLFPANFQQSLRTRIFKFVIRNNVFLLHIK